jgi:cytoskeletal protein CcmA (bactofilin family)
LYVNNNPGDSYDGVFGFQNKANFTDGRITALKPMVFISGVTVTGSMNVTGSVNFSGNNGFPVNVDGTISSRRFSFVGNPFNSNIGGTFGSLKFDGNNTRMEFVNNDLGTPATNSAVYATTNTGSNFTSVQNSAAYGGTTAKTVVTNTSGTRTFEVDVDSTVITGSLTVSGSATITGSVQGNVTALSISSNTASLNLNDGNFFTLQLVSGSATHINPSNIKPGQTVNIRLNTTGSGTVNFPSSVKQVSGSSYVPTTTTSVDIITLVSFDSSSLFLANVKNLI